MSDRATPPSDPDEHDAWLREALRHAPDASAAPPLSLRNAIFAEARAATSTTPRAAPGPSLADRFAELWSWLARPPVAAGFAGIMAATLVGLMWWDRPLDETMTPPPEPTALSRAPVPEATVPSPVQAAPTATPVPVKPATAMPQAAPKVTQPDALQTSTDAAAATTAERAARTTEQASRRATGAAAAPPAELFATPAKSAAAADVLRDEPKDTRPSSSNVAPAAPAAPRLQSAPAPFPARDARDADAQAPLRSQPGALAKKAEKNDFEEKREAAVNQNRPAAPAAAPSPTTRAAPNGMLDKSTAGASNDASATGRLAAPPRPLTAARQRAADLATATTRPMAPLLAALSNAGARWSRSRPAGEGIAVDAEVQAWLGRVDGATTEWQPLAERLSRGDAARTADAGTLMLYREGRIAAIVEVEDGGVFFETRPGQIWFAPLAPDAVARLRANFPSAGR